MSRGRLLAAFLVLSTVVSACGDGDPPPPKAVSPARATITQILIQYASKQVKDVKRTPEEARTLALSLIERIRSGERMETLMLQFTDDRGDDGKPFNDGVYLILRGSIAMPALGGLTDEQMQAGFIASPEFYSRANHSVTSVPRSAASAAGVRRHRHRCQP